MRRGARLGELTSGWERPGRTGIVCKEKRGQEVGGGENAVSKHTHNTPAPRERADLYRDNLFNSTS